ncbi:hypothetical protein AMJ80_08685 [bacterium SM23_31]|nr:MAG: hypothetical protein AMJ80_08685 [bacterium SM23_31]
MHEFSLAVNIFDIVLETVQKEKINRVYTINLDVGKLMAVVPESLIFGFEAVSKGTLLENTRLEINEIPVTVRCKKCGTESEIDEFIFMCPKCNGIDLEMLSGQDMQIVSLEVEKNGNYNA